MLELIASTYGAPDEVAAAYRDTEAKVRAALRTPNKPPNKAPPGALARFFGVFTDPRAYMSLFFMFLAIATGLIYFIVSVVGVSLSVGLAVLIIGVPFFLMFIALTRVMSLVEGRIVEGLLGERMPRRPQHPGPAKGFWQAHRRHARRQPHLDHPRLFRADAAHGHRRISSSRWLARRSAAH